MEITIGKNLGFLFFVAYIFGNLFFFSFSTEETGLMQL